MSKNLRYLTSQSLTIEVKGFDEIKNLLNFIAEREVERLYLICWDDKELNTYKNNYSNKNTKIFFHTKEEFEKKLERGIISNSIIMFVCLENNLSKKSNLKKVICTLENAKKNYIWLTKSPIYRMNVENHNTLKKWKKIFYNEYHIPQNIKNYKEIMEIESHNKYSSKRGVSI